MPECGGRCGRGWGGAAHTPGAQGANRQAGRDDPTPCAVGEPGISARRALERNRLHSPEDACQVLSSRRNIMEHLPRFRSVDFQLEPGIPR